VGGSLALLSGLILRSQVVEVEEITPYLILIGIGGGLWLVGVAIIPLIVEEPGATKGAREPFREARAGIALLKKVGGYRRYVLLQNILLTVELSLPFYTLLVRSFTEGTVSELGLYVVVISLAQALSSPIWGRLSDRSSKKVMGIGGLVATLAGLISLEFSAILGVGTHPLILSVPLLLVGFASAGVRLSRKTYIIDGALQRDRPTYIALSNSIVGKLTLLGSGLGWLADLFSL
jgi:hypothetical protein